MQTTAVDVEGARAWAARGWAQLAEATDDAHGPYGTPEGALEDVLPAAAPQWLREAALRLLRDRAAQHRW